jgi:hypothetical protein
MRMALRTVARRAVSTFALPLALCAFTGLLTAQALKITEPKDGTVVYTGQVLTVVVNASPAFAFQEIIIAGGGLGFSQTLHAPPYRFSLIIPLGTRPRGYHLTADGSTEPGKGVSSDPVEIQVERPDRPLKLTAKHAVLNFMSVGHNDPITAVGQFADVGELDLRESTGVKYFSDNPRVATVNHDGLVTATGPGSAKITVRYNGASTVVPVAVEKPPVAR